MVSHCLIVKLTNIKSPKYGTANNLSATLPLLAETSFKVHELCRDRKRVNTIARELASEFRTLWPTVSGPEAIQKAAHALLLVAYQNPSLNWEKDPGFRAVVNVSVTAIAMDNVVDRLLEIHPSNKNLKMFMKFMEAFGKSDINFEQIFSTVKDEEYVSSMGLLGVMCNSFHKAIRDLGELDFEGGRKNVEYFYNEMMSGSIATFCTLLEKSTAATRFSSQGFKRHVGQHAHAMAFCVEANLLATSCPDLSPNVRNTLLFKILMDAFGNATALVNAICGLGKDIIEDTWEDTTILRDVVLKGLSLQESWNNAVEDFAGEVHDMNLALTLLEDNFEDEQGLEEFIEIFQNTFMGICYAYADEFAAERYLGSSVKVLTDTTEVIQLPENMTQKRQLIRIGEVAGMHFGLNVEGIPSNMREIHVAADAKSLGVEGFCLSIRDEEIRTTQLNQQA